MTDPTDSPQPNTVPGIRDYEVRLRLHRHHAGDDQESHVVVRVPASSSEVAFQHGIRIGQDIDINNGDGDTPPWHVSMPDTQVTDVDHIPAPAEVEAELRHWRTVVSALATRMPFMLRLTAEEYAAADPADIVAAPVGEGSMLFLSNAVVEAATRPAAAMTAPGADPVIEPATAADLDNLAASHGDLPDPDVRRVAAATLARAKTGEVEIWVSGAWHRLLQATIDHEQGTVKLDASGGDATVAHDLRILSRPATAEGYGSDLPKAATAGQEMLTDNGWMKVQSATYTSPLSGAFKVRLVNDLEDLQTSIEPGTAVLLRPQRPGWWS